MLSLADWKNYRLGDLFELQRGRRILRRDLKPGGTPYVRASALNNGVSGFVDLSPDFPGGLVTVSSNGSVAEAFYQDAPFVASDDVVVLLSEEPLSVGAALFLCTVIGAEKYRFSYGRKWFSNRMRDHVIQLPVKPDGRPDWIFAENYMRQFPLLDIVKPATGSSY